jgi:hypothetical protein
MTKYFSEKLNLEKAVNHGEHGGHNEKPRTYAKNAFEIFEFRCVRRARRGWH